MRRIISLIFLLNIIIFSNGVSVVDAANGYYLKLISSKVDISVDNQVAIFTATNTFKNQYSTNKQTKFAFPLSESASVTAIEWYHNGQWHTAQLTAGSPDTTLPGPVGSINQALKNYLGNTPFYFGIPEAIKSDSILIVKITYVQLLKYSNGSVNCFYPNKYNTIQTSSLASQELSFTLNSQRTIDSLYLKNLTPQTITNNGHEGIISYTLNEQPATENYNIVYSLSLNELGLFSMSSKFTEGTLPDSIANGFFIFVAEPNPNQSTIIRKVFTLIIDRSGSMGGSKIEQAKNAAKFIVNNLNEGDKFNIIDFDDIITPFRTNHVLYTNETRDQALAYINNLTARGMTNISGAFQMAIPQFSTVNDSTANIIVFFTDGLPTAGVTTTPEILNIINTLTSSVDSSLCIFTFGVGADVDKQLLTLIAKQHNGISDFLGSEELEAKISDFYLKIKNPVLINTDLTITPNNVILERYPQQLPNLYKGQQLIVAGRYQEPGNVSVRLTGTAFGQQKTYTYPLVLSDSSIERYRFQTKIWAKLKIEDLLVQYYSLNPSSPQAAALKAQIINVSLKYGVASPFTSFISTDINDMLFEIQRLNVNGTWETITSFTKGEIKEGNVESLVLNANSENGKIVLTWQGFGNNIYYDFVSNAGEYSYRIKYTNSDGTIKYSKTVTVTATVPDKFNLEQNYPNPFNPSTVIRYTVGGTERIGVKLRIFNSLGQEMMTLVNEEKEPGNYLVDFNAAGLSTGVYFYKIDAGNFSSTKKMILMK